MAVRAYVLLTCVPRETHRVVDALRQLPGVETADAVVGTYDAIMAVRAGSMATLLELLKSAQHQHWTTLFSGRFDEDYFGRSTAIGQAHERIGLLPGVVSTATHVVVEHDRHTPGGDMPRWRP